MDNKINDLNLLIKLILDDSYELTEKDFYPPNDTRLYYSNIEDIINGDNFDDYVEYFYDQYEDELFDN